MAFQLPEIFPGGSALLTFFNNLALALIANTIFCYFQVHRPDYFRKIKVRKAISQSLFQIKHVISFRIEHIYKEKYGTHVLFQDMPLDKLNTLFDDMLLKKSCAVKTYNEDVEKCEYLTNLDAICLSCVEASDICTHILQSYSTDLDEELLSTLEQIYKSFFVVFFRTHANENNPGSSWWEFFLRAQKSYTQELQKAYIRLIKYLS